MFEIAVVNEPSVFKSLRSSTVYPFNSIQFDTSVLVVTELLIYGL